MFYLVLISILILIAVVVATPYVLDEFKKAVKSSPKADDFGHFSFTLEEWKYVYQQEFVEDEKGKKFLNKYFGVISYGKNFRENVQGEVIFSSREIYLSDGENGKTFTVNSLNYFGNGVHLVSIRLLHLSPVKKLQVNVRVDSTNADLSPIDFDLEYLLPIPESSLEKIDEILKAYGKIVLAS